MNTSLGTGRRFLSIITLLLAWAGITLQGQTESPSPPATTPLESQPVQELLDYLANAAQEHGATAFAAFVEREGSLSIHSSSDDRTSKETPLPMNTLREPLESLLLARLVFQEKLEWDWKASRIYSRFSIGGTNEDATLLQLLDNTAGIPSEADKRFEDDWFGPADTFGLLQQTTAIAPPGEAFAQSRLSSLAATMLAVYAVKHDDQTLAEDTPTLIQKQVAEPLGLSSLTISPTSDAMQLSLKDLSKWLRSEMLIAQAPDGLMFARPVDVIRRWAPAEWTRNNQEQGYGWHTHSYRDLNIVARGGDADKTTRMLAGFIPKEQLVFAVWVEGGDTKAINTLIEELPLALVEMMRAPQ